MTVVRTMIAFVALVTVAFGCGRFLGQLKRPSFRHGRDTLCIQIHTINWWTNYWYVSDWLITDTLLIGLDVPSQYTHCELAVVVAVVVVMVKMMAVMWVVNIWFSILHFPASNIMWHAHVNHIHLMDLVVAAMGQHVKDDKVTDDTWLHTSATHSFDIVLDKRSDIPDGLNWNFWFVLHRQLLEYSKKYTILYGQ